MTYILVRKQPPLRSQQKKDLYKLLVARSDITAALTACELCLKYVTKIGDDLYYPLFTSIVICYARPFTNNEPYGALAQKWNKFELEEFEALHKAILKARHELVAHSDMLVRKAKIIPPNVVNGRYADGREVKSTHIGTETSFYLFPIPMLRKIPELARDLGSRINDEIEKMVESLYGGMELPNAKFSLRIDEGL